MGGSRRENRQRMRERQEACRRHAAARTIQELWKLKESAQLLQRHVTIWQKFPRRSVPPVDDSAREQRVPPVTLSTSTRHRCVSFGTNTTHDSPEVLRRQRENSNHVLSWLECRICGHLADAPMSAACCTSASAFGLVCFGCMYQFLQLHRAPMERDEMVRCWSLSCKWGCHIRLGTRSVHDCEHRDSPPIDLLRDQIGGSSRCFACDEVFECTSALRRHIATRCTKLHTGCRKCAFYGTRAAVVVHERREHETLTCPCCATVIRIAEWPEHVRMHRRQLAMRQRSASGIWDVFPDGTCVHPSPGGRVTELH